MTLSVKKLIKVIKAVYGVAIAMVYFPMAWFWMRHPKDELAQAVSDILILGFIGSKKSSLSARLLARQVLHGQVNGVFFVKENIGSQNDLKGLKGLFNYAGQDKLFAIDHEGGAVQRLSKQHGVTRLPRARQFSLSQLSDAQTKAIYAQAGKELNQWGFNVNLGPVVDIHDAHNEVIGIYGRSFGSDPRVVAFYASAFVEGFRSQGVICALKHFPGHGRSRGDSHHQLVDISSTWSKEELEPYRLLIDRGLAPMIMVGHLRLDIVDPSSKAATLSPVIIKGILRKQLNYQGVVISDDLDMESITNTYSRRQAVIEALKAGNDLLLIRNLFKYDPLLPKRVLHWVRKAIQNGELQECEILASANRIRKLKESTLRSPSTSPN